jgi:hypothetical protein
LCFRKLAQEHIQPFEVSQTKEYEVPYLDDDAYLMQKLWAEKMKMKQEIADHDEYMRLETKNAKNIFKRGLRKTFDRVEHLPQTIVKNAREKESK